jgi:hypothetical protein
MIALWAVGSLYPSKLGCCQIERPIPGHGQESFATTPLSIALAAREPALADHQLVNARRRMHCCRNRSNKRRRIGGRCRMHGGMSPGAPKGNTNAFKHGHYTAEAIASRREIAKLLRDARALVKQVS